MTAVHRVEVREAGAAAGVSAAALAARLQREATALGLDKESRPVRVQRADVYLIEGAITEVQLAQVADEVLADPVTQRASMSGGALAPGQPSMERTSGGDDEQPEDVTIEVHPLPGVMDPDALAVESAVRALLGIDVRVRTGKRYDMVGVSAAGGRRLAEACLANTVIHAVHEGVYLPSAFPAARAFSGPATRDVNLRELDDAALEKLSRQAHLFLSLEEMKAIQAEYQRLEREPREIELETLAQTWSEHCVHKTLKARVRYREEGIETSGDQRIEGQKTWRLAAAVRKGGRSGGGHTLNADGTVTIDNLLKRTVAAATHELIAEGVDWCLSVFTDNSGVIAFDEKHAVCMKVETHNHPSAIEPYGGAATGIGGCIRDIIGTAGAAKPIAATDVFCVAHPGGFTAERANSQQPTADDVRPLPAGCLHPVRILTQVVAGVRDYGNRMGIPTVSGGVWFDNDYVGNPLVYCGCIGIMPRPLPTTKPQRGDVIVALGGRTGRDGIHGATFSSAELTDTHADEFSHAVQIGNAVTEKMMLDAILAARDHAEGPLFTAITDCGAGGFSSAVGEMAKEIGAAVHLDRAPLKYEGLSPTEIWISEAQERMVLAVPPPRLARLRDVCEEHGVELCELGTFGTEGHDLILNYHGEEVGRLSMHFLHEGLPSIEREALWERPTRHVRKSKAEDADSNRRGETNASSRSRKLEGLATRVREAGRSAGASIKDWLLALLAHPNIASKHWIIRQYDHEVQGGTVVKPIVGAGSRSSSRLESTCGGGPSDGAVLQPVAGSARGLAVGCGLATGWKDDPYLMALAAVDECVRNLVCIGADPDRIAILDNFCWPGVKDAAGMGSLVRAAEGCYDAAKAFRTPFVSGKDSLNNQFTTDDGRTIKIPPTLLISGMGIVPDVAKAMTMDLKEAGNLLVCVGATGSALGGSHLELLGHEPQGAMDAGLPVVDLDAAPRTARAVHGAITAGLVRSAHDCSEGGVMIAATEMAIAGDLGLTLDLALLKSAGLISRLAQCFAETPSRYLLEVRRSDLPALAERLGGTPHAVIGEVTGTGTFELRGIGGFTCGVDELRSTWMQPLDW